MLQSNPRPGPPIDTETRQPALTGLSLAPPAAAGSNSAAPAPPRPTAANAPSPLVSEPDQGASPARITPGSLIVRDAIDTLEALREQALAGRDKAERLLDRPDDLPRGELPVLARISAHETRALHLRLAIEALGGRVDDSSHEIEQRIVRDLPMPVAA